MMAALSFLHEALSELCPPGSLPSQEAINTIYGPTFLGYATVFIAAVRELHDAAMGEPR